MPSIGQSLPHDSAREHVRGEAVYVDDIPPLRGELIVDFVGSPVAHGRISSVDVTAARQVPGIVAVFTAKDVPENLVGPVFHDEDLLATEIVHMRGQSIVAIAGESRAAITAAKALVMIKVEPLPPVLTIEEAIERKQFIGPTRKIARGDVDSELTQAMHRLFGELQIGGQEHFYLEAQAALAIPGEAGTMTVESSTQNTTEIQAVVARCLKLQLAQVVCTCRRMGGGFGGKETQAAMPALLAALTAAKTGRPARCVLGHEQDFRTTGKRHPYLARYEVGFDDDGRISALKTDFYSNGGYSADLSPAVLERTLLHGENAYFIPHVAFTGTVCRTNLPSNTAFRGFGGPQAVAATECVVEEIAARLGVDALEIRRRNLYGTDTNNVAPYGQVVRDHRLHEILDRLAASSDYVERRSAVAEFNATSPTHLKGIALTPVKFGISFTRRTLNQANALVNVYLDGTVQVSTGGTEMGQGLNTKLRQIVADQFGISAGTIRVMVTSTEKSHNTSPTAASASTDLNGAAAVRACEPIRDRLAVVAASMLADTGIEPSPESMTFADEIIFDRRAPERRLPFAQVVREAYERRVNLGERGFYATPGVDLNRETGRGTPFLYYTCGATTAEVLIDRFTGELRVERVDLLMDLGRMINPAIDRGQVVGGFVQGMGWVTTEALLYGPDGALWSDSATTYKIPNVTDIPTVFNVDFLDGPDNRMNVCGGKAVGEPPLLMAVAVWAAVKQALASAAPDRRPQLDLPATNEEILRRLMEQSEPSPERNGDNDGHLRLSGVLPAKPQAATVE
jgi:xanthine dehydrogenase large subunit